MAVVQIMQDKLHANLGDLFKSLAVRMSNSNIDACHSHISGLLY